MYRQLGDLINVRREVDMLVLLFNEGTIFVNENKVYIYSKDDIDDAYIISSYSIDHEGDK